MQTRESIQDGIEEQAAVFAAFADPTRLRLVKLLCRQRSPDALCVNALAAILGVSQSAVSQHLRVLKATGLVKGERRGYHVHYFVNTDTLERHREVLWNATDPQGPCDVGACEGQCPERRE
jgi:ArsR family transcriptional regulator